MPGQLDEVIELCEAEGPGFRITLEEDGAGLASWPPPREPDGPTPT